MWKEGCIKAKQAMVIIRSPAFFTYNELNLNAFYNVSIIVYLSVDTNQWLNNCLHKSLVIPH